MGVRKILTANDLGLTGGHQAGIAIPKDPAILAFFPPLDPAQYNPDCVISVRTPQTGDHWELRYVYYNNKVHDRGTRNERRLTGTTKMLRALGAAEGDTVGFRRTTFGDIEVYLEPAAESVLSRPAETILKSGWRLTISDS